MTYWGWDYSWWRPSNATLASNGVQFVCRYLSYDTTGKNITQPEYENLLGQGISVVLNWEWNPTDPLSGYNLGRQHAQKAESLRQALGAPDTAPIYFSADFNATASQQAAIDQYLAGAASVIGSGRVGVYGSYYVVERCYANGSAAWFWQTYAWSNGNVSSHAHLYQYNNGVQGGNADQDKSLKDNFGQILPDGSTGGGTSTAIAMLSASSSLSTGVSGPPIDPPTVIPGGNSPYPPLPGDPKRVKILVADENLNILGPELVDWSGLTCTKSLNTVGSGSFTVPASDEYVELLTTPGNRIHVFVDNQLWFSGPIEQPGAYSWGVADDNSGVGKMTIGFADNNAYLTWRLIYPDPTKAAGSQGTAKTYQIASVNNATAIVDIVTKNLGATAITGRKLANLVVSPAPSGIGGNVAVTARFDVLTDVIRDLASQQGSLVFDVIVNSDDKLEFQVWAPRDLSETVIFSRSRNNLSALTTDPQAPTCNAAIVFPDVDNDDQTITERTDADSIAAWGRIEQGVSRTDLDDNSDGSTPTTAQKTKQWEQDGDLALLSGHESVNITATVVETDDQRYGVDFLLGDTVSVEMLNGFIATDVVSQVVLTASSPDGFRVVPTIGSADAGSAKVGDPIIQLIRNLTRAVGRIQRGY